jgi:O-antigen chain-terminating methyltransferase
MVTFHLLQIMNTSSPLPFDYHAFEDFFRGSSRAVAMRLEVYLPLLKLLRQVCDGPALDIGCGKGEWLDLLGKMRFPAAGIEPT